MSSPSGPRAFEQSWDAGGPADSSPRFDSGAGPHSLASHRAASHDQRSRQQVRDGDTIEIAGLPVRLNGLHAPELREPGGIQARDWMAAATLGKTVTCRLNGEKNRDRWVGICSDRNGDLAAQLINAGLGRDCARYSGGRYRHLERPAAARFRLPPYCVR